MRPTRIRGNLPNGHLDQRILREVVGKAKPLQVGAELAMAVIHGSPDLKSLYFVSC